MEMQMERFAPLAQSAAAAATATPTSRNALAVPRAVLFDLDGTLIDSVPDITRAVAELLKSEHLPPLSEDQVRIMVGRGLRALVRRVYDAQGLALDEASLQCRIDAMAEIYSRHLVGHTLLMPGVREALEFFRSQGCAMAVVTNKLLTATETILQHFDIADYFAVLIGDSNSPPMAELARKPQPDMLFEALRQLKVEPAQAVMIGDSGVDVQAAKAAGVTAIAVRGGYSSEPLEGFAPDVILDRMGAVPAYFSRR
jgi:phosphoglycolate phosphatase